MDSEDQGVTERTQDPAHGPELGVGFVLGRVAHVLSLRFDRELEPFGVRALHLCLLKAVRAYGPLPQQRLAEFLGADRATVAALVDDLEALGLAERHPVQGDRRTKEVKLTEAGFRLHERAGAAAGDQERRAFAALNVAERDQLRQLLLRLAPDPAMLVPPESAGNRRRRRER